MDKNKINIDQFFKTPLQNVEGNADDAMFEEIKKKVDASKVNDTPKISVDNYFKAAMLGFEVNADDVLFDAIKSKVDASKITIDNYFKEALLDYNSNAGSIPFIQIQNKLDRERVIDEHFKNALQNYEGNARDDEFAVIRKRVLQVKQIRNRKRYAWFLLLLLIPAWFVGAKYFSNNNTGTSNAINTERALPGTTARPNTGNGSNSLNNTSSKENGKELTEKNIVNTNNNAGNPGNNNAGINNNNSNNGNTNSNSTQGNTNASTSDAGVTPSQENSPVKNDDVSKTENEPSDNTKEVNKDKTDPDVKGDDASVTKVPAPKDTNKPGNINIRKPKFNYTVQLFGAASRNNRYLNADTSSKAYLATRNASDKTTTKYNFGVDLLHAVGKLSYGIGIHENQFGQKGLYQITKSIYDSFPYYDTTGTKILFYIVDLSTLRDTTYKYAYDNIFTAVEIPLQVSYRICKASKIDVEVGVGILVSYITMAKGAIPNATASEVVQLKNAMSSINRFGTAGTVSMKVNYNITSRWQLGTSLYLKSNMTSLYKKSSGVNELPYSAGMRCGIGFKF